MGILSSCLNTQFIYNPDRTAKVIDSQGKLRLVKLPTTVAEVLLKNYPGFTLSSVEELRRTRRIPAMRANDMLLGGKVYLLVPVDRVNSKLTSKQLRAVKEILISSCCDDTLDKRKRACRFRGFSGCVEHWFPCRSTGATVQIKPRVSKGWIPTLEPILEE